MIRKYMRYIILESAKSKRLFYTKNTLSRVVIFSFFKICSISWKQFFFLVDFGKFEIHDFFTHLRIISVRSNTSTIRVVIVGMSTLHLNSLFGNQNKQPHYFIRKQSFFTISKEKSELTYRVRDELRKANIRGYLFIK